MKKKLISMLLLFGMLLQLSATGYGEDIVDIDDIDDINVIDLVYDQSDDIEYEDSEYANNEVNSHMSSADDEDPELTAPEGDQVQETDDYPEDLLVDLEDEFSEGFETEAWKPHYADDTEGAGPDDPTGENDPEDESNPEEPAVKSIFIQDVSMTVGETAVINARIETVNMSLDETDVMFWVNDDTVTDFTVGQITVMELEEKQLYQVEIMLDIYVPGTYSAELRLITGESKQCRIRAMLAAPDNVLMQQDESRFCISWNEVAEADGYQVCYSETDRSNTILVDNGSDAEAFLVLSAAQKTGRLFVKVRAYIIKDGEKVYGAWSEEQVITCEHESGVWEVEKLPTCDEKGLNVIRCVKCQTIVKRESVPVVSHDLGEWIVTSQATALVRKAETRYCSRCDYREIRTSSKLKATGKLNATSLSLKQGQSFSGLQLTGLAKDDYVEKWVTSNKKVFTVSGKANGTCVLKAKNGAAGKSATLRIYLASGLKKQVKIYVKKSTIKTKYIKGLDTSYTVLKGKRIKLGAYRSPISSQEELLYRSKDSSIATVSSAGTVKGIKKGRTKVVITSGSIQKTVTIYVK